MVRGAISGKGLRLVGSTNVNIFLKKQKKIWKKLQGAGCMLHGSGFYLTPSTLYPPPYTLHLTLLLLPNRNRMPW